MSISQNGVLSDAEIYAYALALAGKDWRNLPISTNLRALLEGASAQGPEGLKSLQRLLPLYGAEITRKVFDIEPDSPAPLIIAPIALAERPSDIHQTDLGNAIRLVNRHGPNIRYVYKWSQWLIWNNRQWLPDQTGEIERLAKDTIINLYAEASAIDGQDDASKSKREALIAHALRSEGKAKIESMIALARSEPGIAIPHEALDREGWLLNCANGTLDLRTGQLREHARTDHLTKFAPVDYNPRAEAPTWRRFLARIFNSDTDLIEFVRRAVGYTLTADISEQCLFFMYGVGKNGKSTFIETLMCLLGDYALKTPTESIMARTQGQATNDLARLPGARFVVAAEVEEGRRLNESLVKDLTGGDRIVARFLYSELFEFLPTHKLWMYGNHKPVIRGTDEGIWRRMRLIPFTVIIPPDERDPKLLDKLKNELPGILAWAVEGCKQWRDYGLNEPKIIIDSTSRYRAEMDLIGLWLEECCVTGPNFVASASDLYSSYAGWCGDQNETPVTQRRFGLTLTERGFERWRGTDHKNMWRGIGIRTNA